MQPSKWLTCTCKAIAVYKLNLSLDPDLAAQPSQAAQAITSSPTGIA